MGEIVVGIGIVKSREQSKGESKKSSGETAE